MFRSFFSRFSSSWRRGYRSQSNGWSRSRRTFSSASDSRKSKNKSEEKRSEAKSSAPSPASGKVESSAGLSDSSKIVLGLAVFTSIGAVWLKRFYRPDCEFCRSVREALHIPTPSGYSEVDMGDLERFSHLVRHNLYKDATRNIHLDAFGDNVQVDSEENKKLVALVHDRILPSVCQIIHPSGKSYRIGTGFIVSNDGMVITCGHTVAPASILPEPDLVWVRLNSGHLLAARVLVAEFSDATDFSILKIIGPAQQHHWFNVVFPDAPPLSNHSFTTYPSLALETNPQLQIGADVALVGKYPQFPYAESVRQLLDSHAVVQSPVALFNPDLGSSALVAPDAPRDLEASIVFKRIDSINFIHVGPIADPRLWPELPFDGPLLSGFCPNNASSFVMSGGRSGTSGGPVINRAGQVVGMAFSATNLVSDPPVKVAPLAVFIPAQRLNQLVKMHQDHGRISKPKLGLQLDTAETGGALVVAVEAKSPAAAAGIKPGDIIRNVGGKTVNVPDDVYRWIGFAVDSPFQFQYSRDNVDTSCTVTPTI